MSTFPCFASGPFGAYNQFAFAGSQFPFTSTPFAFNYPSNYAFGGFNPSFSPAYSFNQFSTPWNNTWNNSWNTPAWNNVYGWNTQPFGGQFSTPWNFSNPSFVNSYGYNAACGPIGNCCPPTGFWGTTPFDFGGFSRWNTPFQNWSFQYQPVSLASGWNTPNFGFQAPVSTVGWNFAPTMVGGFPFGTYNPSQQTGGTTVNNPGNTGHVPGTNGATPYGFIPTPFGLGYIATGCGPINYAPAREAA